MPEPMSRWAVRAAQTALWRWFAISALLGAVVVGMHPELRGWRPDHAHTTLGVVVPPHEHPWDRSHPVAAEPSHGSEQAAVAFSDPDAAGGSGTVDVPSGPPLIDRLRGVTVQVLPTQPVMASYRLRVPTPPPRA